MKSGVAQFQLKKIPASRAAACTIAFLAVLCFLVATRPLQAQTEIVLHSFSGGTDGANPYAALLRDREGTLYGTTVNGGGSSLNCYNGCGTVFKVSPVSGEATLYRFTGNTFTGNGDGAQPFGGLTQDAKGNLFGTTSSGGFYVGTVFQVTSAGVESLLHVFQGSPMGDGAGPYASLMQDPHGNLYGTTYSGGLQCACGTVFEITPQGATKVLYSFTGGSDGSFPFSSLLRTAGGDLFGTTVFGGTSNLGTVFKLAQDGTETVLHSFSGGSDGYYPEAGLILDRKGNLLGTTAQGGAFGSGTVFEITSAGKEVILYSFQGGVDGALPACNLILDNFGNIYGTTYQGGASGAGTVFEIDPGGTERILYSFTGGADGGSPVGGLVFDHKGNFYGTTFSGGTSGLGTVFELIP